ncbi:hypothetical protein V491_01824 [Pseudogymnoascus sp. VKM F-3775]|nr:hypothetical protein V491_01824 [Pseudogymnoascus sp. VKM F-3775]
MDPDFEKAWNSRRADGFAPPQDIYEFCRAANAAQREAALAQPHFKEGHVEDIYIPMRDGYKNTSRVWWPSGATGQEPLVVWYHGGGFCLGDAAFEEEVCQRLCRGLNAVLVSVNYRLAPDDPFPTSINDCWDSLQWIASHSRELRANRKSGFIISGSSAGGNICAVLSHLARDADQIHITGVYLGMPIVVHPRAVPEIHQASYRSYEENRDAACLSQADLELVINAYNPDPKSPLYSALLWPSGHADLTPTYFQVGEFDVVRDDGIIYERVLREAGVKTKIDTYPVPHAFQGVFPELPIVKRYNDDMVAGIRWLLDH